MRECVYKTSFHAEHEEHKERMIKKIMLNPILEIQLLGEVKVVDFYLSIVLSTFAGLGKILRLA